VTEIKKKGQNLVALWGIVSSSILVLKELKIKKKTLSPQRQKCLVCLLVIF